MVTGQPSFRSIHTAIRLDLARALIGRQLPLGDSAARDLAKSDEHMQGTARHLQRALLLLLPRPAGGGRRRGYRGIELRFGRRNRASPLPRGRATPGSPPHSPKHIHISDTKASSAPRPGGQDAGTRAPSSDPRRGAAVPCSWEPSAATCAGQLLPEDTPRECAGSNPHPIRARRGNKACGSLTRTVSGAVPGSNWTARRAR
jgi:hypothetical protein